MFVIHLFHSVQLREFFKSCFELGFKYLPVCFEHVAHRLDNMGHRL